MRQGTPGFVGARLRQAREARGVTAISLAEIVGVTRAAMSQYEHGHQSPSPETMRRISDALNLPVHWFLRPIVPHERGTRFFRSMASATKGARLRAAAKQDWLEDLVGLLQHYVKMPAVQLPIFDVPADPAQISNAMIETLATDARRFWGLRDGPISNVVWLLENRGCIVSRLSLNADTLDAFSEIADKRPYVVLSSEKQSAARSRFDAAHELGHLLLHRQVDESLLTQTATFDLIEDQAHYFAGAFLLPAASFGSECRDYTLDEFRSLKERWRVSIGAMIMRASELKLINQHQKKNLQINLGRRRWKTREPLDDVLEPERPRFLKTCIETLVTRGVMPTTEPSLLLGLPAKDIEELAALDPGYLSRAEAAITLNADESVDDERGMILRFPHDQQKTPHSRRQTDSAGRKSDTK